jgi:hypothetical protein
LLVVIVASAALSVAADITDEKVVPSTMCGRFFYVEIEVDGKEPGSRVTLNALFDTGGAQLSIDPGTVKRLWGLKVSHGTMVKLRNPTAGPLRFDTLKPRAWSMEHLSRIIGLEIDVFLPFRTFDSMLLILDYPKGEMRVAKGRLPKPDGIEVFNARGPDKRPYLKVDIGGLRRRLLIDSGSSGAISIHETDSLSWASEPRPLRVSQGMEKIYFREIGRLDESVRIGKLEVPMPIVEVTDDIQLFGTEIMSHAVWTFDQRSRRVRIRPSSSEPVELEGIEGTGAVFKPTRAGYEIIRVLSGTPAEEAGLRTGDVLVATKGVGVYERGCERWSDDAPEGEDNPDDEGEDEVTLTIERDGETHVFKVPSVVLVP